MPPAARAALSSESAFIRVDPRRKRSSLRLRVSAVRANRRLRAPARAAAAQALIATAIPYHDGPAELARRRVAHIHDVAHGVSRMEGSRRSPLASRRLGRGA